MKSSLHCVIGLAVGLFLAFASTHALATGCPFGHDTCKMGFVWRDAVADDHVCVVGSTRAQAARDNQLATQLARTLPTGECRRGYVPRLATPSDQACVKPKVAQKTVDDNALSADNFEPYCHWVASTIAGLALNVIDQSGNVLRQVPVSSTPIDLKRGERLQVKADLVNNTSSVGGIVLMGDIGLNGPPFRRTCTTAIGQTTSEPIATPGSSLSINLASNTAVAPPIHNGLANVTLTTPDLPQGCSADEDTQWDQVEMGLVERGPPPNGPGGLVFNGIVNVKLQYASEPHTNSIPAGGICRNLQTSPYAQTKFCAPGLTCDIKRTTVCHGWWIFRTCETTQTVDMFCM